MDEILCINVEPVADIEKFIKDCHFPEDAFVLVERFPQHVIGENERYDLLQFMRLKDKDKIKFAHSISGRVFCSKFELRWQEENGQYRVVYLGEKRGLPGLKEDSRPLAGLELGEQKKYYLFGEVLNEKRLVEMGLENEVDSFYYAEVRIPRLLQYPMQGQRVQLVVQEYVDEKTGQVQLFRFQDLTKEG